MSCKDFPFAIWEYNVKVSTDNDDECGRCDVEKNTFFPFKKSSMNI